jgi:uroporphyrin-III C-methyltransferase
VELACEGHEVIRLKGGDPYIFGRGSEEAAACHANGIPVEIVPGITAAQGASAASGVPLTHRGLATGVRYITGHRAANAELDIDWDQVADPAATLVIYMGVANIAEIAARLIRAGLPSLLPVLAAASVTTSRETLLRSTLSRIGSDAVKLPQDAPVLFIVGRVVELYRSPQAVMEALCHA